MMDFTADDAEYEGPVEVTREVLERASAINWKSGLMNIEGNENLAAKALEDASEMRKPRWFVWDNAIYVIDCADIEDQVYGFNDWWEPIELQQINWLVEATINDWRWSLTHPKPPFSTVSPNV